MGIHHLSVSGRPKPVNEGAAQPRESSRSLRFAVIAAPGKAGIPDVTKNRNNILSRIHDGRSFDFDSSGLPTDRDMAHFPLRIVTGPEPATPCDSCTAGCCRNFAVPLTASDIQRIIGERGVAFGDFVCGWGEEQGRIGGGNVPQFYFKDAPGVPFVIAITPRPSQLYPGTRKCPFLQEDGSLAGGSSCRTSCSIYASRPSVCRVFPFHRDAAGQVNVSPDLEARSKEQKPPYTLCPTQWTLTDEQRERVRTISNCCGRRCCT